MGLAQRKAADDKGKPGHGDRVMQARIDLTGRGTGVESDERHWATEDAIANVVWQEK